MNDSESQILIRIKTLLESQGTTAAITEIDRLSKKTGELSRETGNAAVANAKLDRAMGGSRMAMEGLNQIGQGGANIFKGLATTITGVGTALGKVAWVGWVGLITMVVAAGAKLIEMLRGTQKETENLGKQVEKVNAIELVVDQKLEAAKKIEDQFNAAASAADKLAAASAKLSDAKLDADMAQLDLDEANALSAPGLSDQQKEAISKGYGAKRSELKRSNDLTKARQATESASQKKDRETQLRVQLDDELRGAEAPLDQERKFISEEEQRLRRSGAFDISESDLAAAAAEASGKSYGYQGFVPGTPEAQAKYRQMQTMVARRKAFQDRKSNFKSLEDTKGKEIAGLRGRVDAQRVTEQTAGMEAETAASQLTAVQRRQAVMDVPAAADAEWGRSVSAFESSIQGRVAVKPGAVPRSQESAVVSRGRELVSRAVSLAQSPKASDQQILNLLNQLTAALDQIGVKLEASPAELGRVRQDLQRVNQRARNLR